ncbi:LacI family DNA-binding transcriptional regulator [Gillisia hiemivivida]|jgi:LacI family transcriptional regulator|uniref:LacI family transcriptional regulator n=1 Tax=Gillisia hiemivivida TaxID=291190 RepID=A0A5C7A029_9FLAO|nr:LacI family DNA-binding transcriptional regulator [Gillisia hiemivivida]TXD95690.1 LacI family transcriptional regulator [Gillisia hiemivivida]
MRSKITLKELAKLLNVSVSTVSKSLNGSPEISKNTVKRVKELAELHNYSPNLTAVNLKRKSTGNIAVIVPNISNTFFAKVLGGIENEARKNGYQLITYISNESLTVEKQIMDLISNGLADGVLMSVSAETQTTKNYDHIYRFTEYEIPVVLFDRINVDVKLDKVGVDDMQSIYNAVRYLKSKGLNRIGLVCSIGDLGLAQARIDGYKAAMNDQNTTFQKEFLIVSNDPEVLRKQLGLVLDTYEMEAFVSLDYLSTLLTSRVVQEKKLNIPEDIKIIGYVNEDFAPFLWPSISYIDQHPLSIGESATQLLIERIKKMQPKEFDTQILNTKIVHLDSTLI